MGRRGGSTRAGGAVRLICVTRFFQRFPAFQQGQEFRFDGLQPRVHGCNLAARLPVGGRIGKPRLQGGLFRLERLDFLRDFRKLALFLVGKLALFPCGSATLALGLVSAAGAGARQARSRCQSA